MSKVCIIESTNRVGSCTETSTMVHCRNAKAICDANGWDLIEGEEQAHKLNEKYDHIICSYASHYMPWKSYFPYIMNQQKDAKLWWLINDHDVEDNILLRKVLIETGGQRKYNVICNNTQGGFRQWILRKKIVDGLLLQDCLESWKVINLNALTFAKRIKPADDLAFDFFNVDVIPCLYWGSYRKWRKPYFDKYSDPMIMISTSNKNRTKFQPTESSFCGTLSWGDESELHRTLSTFYIEDPHTHTNYAKLANRFYEALSYGVAVFFDSSCMETIERCKYEIPQNCIIDGPQDLFAGDYEGRMCEVSEFQQESWTPTAEKEKQEAFNKIAEIIAC